MGRPKAAGWTEEIARSGELGKPSFIPSDIALPWCHVRDTGFNPTKDPTRPGLLIVRVHAMNSMCARYTEQRAHPPQNANRNTFGAFLDSIS